MHTLAFRDETRVDIAQVAITDQPDAIEKVTRDVSRGAQEFQTRLRFIAGEHWDVDVAGYAFVVESLEPFGLFGDWDTLEAKVSDAAPESDHNYWHLNGVWAGDGNAGLAVPNSGYALTYDATNVGTMIHEFGHCRGLGHDRANTLMSGARHKRFSGSAMDYMGLVSQDHVAHVGSDARLFLVPPETRDEAVADGEHKIVYFDEDRYGVSVYDGTLMIQAWVQAPIANGAPWSTVQSVATLRTPGDSWENVRLVGWREGAAEVTIGEAPQRPHAPLDLPAGTDVVPGIWHDPRYSLQGLDIRLNDKGDVAVYWYTWKGERPYWLVLTGPVVDGRAELTIHAPYALRGERRLREVGRAVLVFDGPNVATMRYNAQIDDWFWTGRGQLELDRIDSPEDDPLTGAFDFKGADHEGVTISVIGERVIDGETIPPRKVGYWFTWEWDSGVLYPTWYYASGPRRGDLTLQRPVDGAHLVETDSYLEDAGTAQVYRTAFRCRERGVAHKLTQLA